MAGPSRRKRTHKGVGRDKLVRNAFRGAKAVDQVHAELADPAKLQRLRNREVDLDLPGLGQHYCLECARHFANDEHLKEHRRGKLHKKRVKLLKEVPYSHAEADAAAGLSTDNGKGRKDLRGPPPPIPELYNDEDSDMRQD